MTVAKDAQARKVTTSMDRTRAFLEEKLGLPGGNLYELPDSEARFSDGAHFRRELPGIQTPDAMKAGLEEAKRRGLVLHRITHTMGIMRNTDGELREMVAIAKDWGVEVILSVGPRATYDLGASVHTPEGGRVAYRLRGPEQLVRGIEDVKRAVDLGIRGVMVYDEGMIYVVDEMRKAGELPANLHIKASGHLGYSNPAAMRVLERLGANSINPVRDLDTPTWAALRAGTTLPLDVSTEAPKSSGGFLRDYDLPEIVRVASPVYAKSGGFEMATHATATSADKARDYVKRVELINRMIFTYFPEVVCSERAPEDLSIPE